MKKYLLVLFIFVLSGCSDTPYQKYIGLWELKNIDDYEIMEIQKVGETIITINRIRKGKVFNGKEQTMELTKLDGELTVGSVFDSTRLVLSNNNTILNIDNYSYKKIDNARLDEVKKEVEKR